jgi:Acetyltransferase (GNAT) domain
MHASSAAIEGGGPAALGGYVPLALRSDWTLERYHGWSILHQDAGLKLLERRSPPVVRYLLLAKSVSRERVDQVIATYRIFRAASIVSFNDFSGSDGELARSVAGRTMRRVNGPRWFGIGTFVLDLDEEEHALWRRITAREKNNCESADRRGVRMELTERPSRNELGHFLRLYEPMARERGLERFGERFVNAISGSASFTLARCLDPAGRTAIANLVYRAHDQGYFLASARAADTPAGGGRLVHWEVAKKLKREGYRFYDLGLVASLSRTDGISSFKRSLGGAFVSSGAEFEWVSPLLAPLVKVFKLRRETLASR